MSAEALAKADFETRTAYGNNYRISTNFRSPRGERSKINQFESIMQNKPNLPDAQMKVSSVITKDYENKSNWKLGEYKANQSQYKANTNPIPERPKMNENLFATKVYENITTFRLEQIKPNQTQFLLQKSV